MQVAIVGAGVIGLACALSLRARGADVTIIERTVPGAGASSGNAGWITPVFASPLPEPGVVRTSVTWLLQRDGPLSIKPRLDPALFRWLWSFWRSANARDFERNVRAYAAFASHALADFDALASRVPLEIGTSGTLFIFTGRRGLEHLRQQIDLMVGAGYAPATILGREDAHDLEPAISKKIVGAILVPQERYLRPEAFVGALTAAAREQGIEVKSGTTVLALSTSDDRTVGIETGSGSITADHVVVAAGAWSSDLLATVGVRVPIQPGNGYAITVTEPAIRLRRPTYLSESHIACTPFEGALRLAGLMELTGIDQPFAPRRFGAIRRGADEYLVGWRGGSEREWVGPRPMTPDGLPVLGAVKGFRNLWIASGHAMLGVTLAPSTGAAIADLICGGRTRYEVAAFDPSRYD